MGLLQFFNRLSSCVDALLKDRFDLLVVVQGIEVVAPCDVEIRNQSSHAVVVKLAVALVRVVFLGINLKWVAQFQLDLEITQLERSYVFNIELDESPILLISSDGIKMFDAIDHNLIQRALRSAFRVHLFEPTDVLVPWRKWV